jgi:hypothetical protein
VAGGVGESTLKSVPVVKVTSAPSVVGPEAEVSAPEMESATAWAAASSVGVSWEYVTRVSDRAATDGVAPVLTALKPSCRNAIRVVAA